MSINDLICCGAKPLFFLDYIACGRLIQEKISCYNQSVADACKYCGTALLGGETAEMPDMYADDEVDLAGFAVGIVERAEDIQALNSQKRRYSRRSYIFRSSFQWIFTGKEDN